MERENAALMMRRLHWLMWITIAGAALCVLLSHAAVAATSTVGGATGNFTLFDTVVDNTATTSMGWFTTIQGLVRNTFLILATLEICWAAALWAFEKDNLNSLAVEIIKKIMFIGFFYALLTKASEWIPTITQTFETVGNTAAQLQQPVTTDGIVADGLAIINLIWAKAPHGFFSVLSKLGQILVAGLVTVGIIIAFTILAAQYFTLKIESYILLAAGAIFLGMGSSSWTKEYVSKYLNYAINVGVRLLVLILVVALMTDTLAQMGAGFTFDFTPLLRLLGIAIMQCLLGIKAPEMAGALLNGGVGFSAGAARGAAGSAIGGAAAVLGVAGGAAKMATSAAQGTGNFGKAVNAGMSLAREQNKNISGTGAALSGLGAALRATAREMPTSAMNAIKGKSDRGQMGGGRGQAPGPISRAAEALQGRVSQGTAGPSGTGTGGTGSGGEGSTGKGVPGASQKSGASAAELGKQPAGGELATHLGRSNSRSSTATSGGESSEAPPLYSRSDPNAILRKATEIDP